MALTAKQQLFVNEYLECWNATEAARRAKYAQPNKQGPRLLVNVGVAAAIKERMEEKAMPANEVLARLAEHARSDVRHFFKFDADGKVDGLNLTEDAPWHLVKSITPTAAGTKLELHDAQAALVHIGRVHGLFIDKTALTDPTGTKEYADTTLDTLKQRLVAQLTTQPAAGAAPGVPREPDAPRDEGGTV